MKRLLTLFALAAEVWGQNLTVDAAHTRGPLKPIWKYFGYDEPNYTYTANGQKLIGELGKLGGASVYIRTHFMLATGDGKASLKWGSTNAYVEDSQGRGIYDWTIVDRILDTYLKAGAKPFVEIGFMPKALSTKPDPYHVEWIPGAPNKEYSAGWSYPPKDFARWGDVVYHCVQHEVELHGRKEVSSWYWEVWNEPDISYWHGTPEEYDELYRSAAAAVKKALPEARVGGPATTGPASEKAALFLRQFLQYCDRTGVPLDFITFHAKGQPKVEDGHAVMGMAKHMRDVESGFRVVNEFPKFTSLPIILSESDPEGCAACSARVYPQNAYRNGSLYAVYTAAMWRNILDAAATEKTNIEGMLTWAFEFEGQPYFDGFRTLATNGIDKPVLNVFRMMGKMSGERLALDGEGLASRGMHDVSVMLWNYGDDETRLSARTVKLTVTGIPNGPAVVHRFVIDDHHSNAWTVWKSMGSPQPPSTSQYVALEKSGALEETTETVSIQGGQLHTEVSLTPESVVLLQLTERNPRPATQFSPAIPPQRN
jgi:xylan 1,4-beta-xylosidase